MRGIVFAGAERPQPDILRKISHNASLLAAADSGLIAMEEAGLKPDWILGDMDSLDDQNRLLKYPPERIMRFNTDKDYTDTELAFNLLRKKGCDEIIIAGGGGGRIDHLFGIRALFEREDPPYSWFTSREEIFCLNEKKSLEKTLPVNSLVSLLPLGSGPWQAESQGLKWPLDNFGWKKDTVGLSNIALNGDFIVNSVRGRFMLIMPIFFND